VGRERTARSQLNNYEQLKQVALSFVPSEHDAWLSVCLSVCLSVDVSMPQPAPGFYSSREQLLLVSNSCRHIPFSDGRVPVSHFSRPNANRCLRVKEGSFSTKNNENKLHKFVDRKYVYYSISAICFGHLGQTSDTTCNSYENLSLKIVRMAETCTRS
jgi:hypothetical protein